MTPRAAKKRTAMEFHLVKRRDLWQVSHRNWLREGCVESDTSIRVRQVLPRKAAKRRKGKA